MEIIIEAVGFEELERVLLSLPGALAEFVQGDGLFAAAGVVRDEARALVPVDTGALKSSLRRARRSARVPTGRGVRTIPNAAAVVRAGRSGVRHAVFVEYGTVNTHARPFLMPALLGTRARQLRAAASAIEAGFFKLGRSLAAGRATARVTRAAIL